MLLICSLQMIPYFLAYDSEKVINLRRLLDCFSFMTGLTINYEKFSLVSWGVDNEWVET